MDGPTLGEAPTTARPEGRGGVRAGIVAGLLAALVVAGIGAVYVSGQPVKYSASNELLVAPRAKLDPSVSSAYWETLGNRQIPATAAAIVNGKRLLKAATSGLDRATRDAITTTVSVVPSTAVVNVVVTAPTASAAEDVANRLSRLSTSQVSDALAPYQFAVISDADGTATLASLSHAAWAGLVAVAALVTGVAVQQLVSWRARAVARRRGVEVRAS
jgi:capsular polysaccharide biosynthesis protein